MFVGIAKGSVICVGIAKGSIMVPGNANDGGMVLGMPDTLLSTIVVPTAHAQLDYKCKLHLCRPPMWYSR